MNFEIIKLNYQKGLWNKIMVRISTQKGIITPAQYKEITGEDF